MATKKWEHSGDVCPRCEGAIEQLCSRQDGEDYQIAERCPFCKWQASYTDIVQLSPGYTEIHREEE